MTTQTQAEHARHRQDPRGANRADIPVGLTALLADMFAVYLKTKNFHWHVSGPHFRDYHLLLDEQATQILATTDTIAERVRKLGAQTVKCRRRPVICNAIYGQQATGSGLCRSIRSC
jgi:starvation-inducible DNA-binding protein